MECPVGAGMARTLECLMEELPEEELMMHVHHLLCDDVRRQEAEELGKQCLTLQEPLTFDDAAIFFSEEEWKEWKELEGWLQCDAAKEFPSLQAVLAQDNQQNVKTSTHKDESDAKLETSEVLSHEDSSTISKPYLQDESFNNESGSHQQATQPEEKSAEKSPRTGNDNIIEERYQPACDVGQNKNNTSDGTANDTDKELKDQTTSQAGSWSGTSRSYNAEICTTEERKYMSTPPEEKDIELRTQSNAQTAPYANSQKVANYTGGNNTATQQKDQSTTACENLQKKSYYSGHVTTDTHTDTQQENQPTILNENETTGDQRLPPAGNSAQNKDSCTAQNDTDAEQKDRPAQRLESSHEAVSGCNNTNDTIGEQRVQPTPPTSIRFEMRSSYNPVNETIEEQNRQRDGKSSDNSSTYSTANDTSREQKDRSTPPDGNSSEKSNICCSANDPLRNLKDELTPHTGQCPETSASSGAQEDELHSLTTGSELKHSPKVFNGSPSQPKEIITPYEEEKFEMRASDITASHSVGELMYQLTPPVDNCNGTEEEQKEQPTPPDGNSQLKRFSYAAVNNIDRQQQDHSTPCENSQKIMNYIAANSTETQQKDQKTAYENSQNNTNIQLKDQLTIPYENSRNILSYTDSNHTETQQKDQKTAYENSQNNTNIQLKDQLTIPYENSRNILSYTDSNHTETQQKDQPTTPYQNSRNILNYAAVNDKIGEHKDQCSPVYGNMFEIKSDYRTVNDTHGKEKTFTSDSANGPSTKPKDLSTFLSSSSSVNKPHYIIVEDDTEVQKHQPTPLTDSWTRKSSSYSTVNSITDWPTQLDGNSFALRCCYGVANTIEEHPARNISETTSCSSPPSGEERDLSATSHGKGFERTTCYCSANLTTREEKVRPTQPNKRDSEKSFQPAAMNYTTNQQEDIPIYLGQNKSEKRPSCTTDHYSNGEQEKQTVTSSERRGSETNLNYGGLNDSAREQMNQPMPPPGITSEKRSIVNSTKYISREQKEHPTHSAGKDFEERFHYIPSNGTAKEQKKQPNPSAVECVQLGSSSEDDATEDLTEVKCNEKRPSTNAGEGVVSRQKTMRGSHAKDSSENSRPESNTSRKPKDQITSAGNNPVNRSSYDTEETKDRATPLIVKWWGKGSSSRTVCDLTGEKKGHPRAPTGKAEEKIDHCVAVIDTNRKQKHQPTPVENSQKKSYQYTAENDAITEPKHRSTLHGEKMSTVRTHYGTQEYATGDNKDRSPTPPTGKGSVNRSCYSLANRPTDQQSADSTRKSPKKSYQKRVMKHLPEEQTDKATPVGKRSARRSSSRIVNNAAEDRSDMFVRKPSEKVSSYKVVNCKAGKRSTPSTDRSSIYTSTKDTKMEQSTNVLEKSASCGVVSTKSGKEKHQSTDSSQKSSEKNSHCRTNTSRGQDNLFMHPAGKCAETKIIFRIVNKVEEQKPACPTGEGLDTRKKKKPAKTTSTGPKEQLKTKQYVCGKCEESFDWKSMLVKHQRTHRVKEALTCSECGKNFTRKALLLQHQAAHIKKALLTCKECGQRFRMIHHLKNHEAKHSDYGLFMCTHCGIRFTQKRQLNQHRLTHVEEKLGSMLGDLTSQDKTLTCDQCGATFTQENDLAQHLLTHNGKKIFACDYCDKIFPQKCDLIVHQLIHKGKKPFTCDQCGESFAEMFRLMQHKLTHPGKKSFTTWLCSLVQS